MTIEMAINAIETHLGHYLSRVPKSLLNNIESIIKNTKTIVKKEVIMPDKKADPPDFPKIWGDICQQHKVDPVAALRTRKSEYLSARTHFVRYVILNYSGISPKRIGDFLKKDRTTVIYMRDTCKELCPIPPLQQRKVIMKTIK